MEIKSTHGVVEDRRTEEEKKGTVGFVVGTDPFLSNWPYACPGKSYVARPFRVDECHNRLADRMSNKYGLKRVRIVGLNYKPRLGHGDHLSIRGFDSYN